MGRTELLGTALDGLKTFGCPGAVNSALSSFLLLRLCFGWARFYR